MTTTFSPPARDMNPAAGVAQRIWHRALEPVDAASLAVFRIAIGMLVAIDAVRKGDHLFGSNNETLFRFPYEGFEWVPSAGAAAPYLAHAWLMGALLVMLGLAYRPAIILTTLLTIFGFLQAQEYYLNHYYLLILTLILMCFVPANRAFALDCLWGERRNKSPSVARMHMWLLKAQTEIVLIYAGIVKLNSDWLQLEPLRSWLVQRKDEVFFGWVWQYDWVITASNYGVIVLHMIGAPLLLWKRTRLPVFLLYCAFHISNHFVFDIGIFPWMTIAMSTLFFPADWPRRLLRLPNSNVASRIPIRSAIAARAFAVFASIWLASQALIPLRCYLYDGDVAWTREGHKFAWRMMLIDRWSPGFYTFAFLPEKHLILIPPLHKLLSERQYDKVSTRPRMAQALAPQLAEMIRKAYNVKDVRVHMYYPVGYNNREATLLIDPKVDLVNAPVRVHPAPWIIKSNEKPLRQIEQFSMKYNFPPIPEMAGDMGLPMTAGCQTLPNKWLRCYATRWRHLSRIGP